MSIAGIKEKMGKIILGLTKNSQFINRVKGELTSIKENLNRLVRKRSGLETKKQDCRAEVEKYTTQIIALEREVAGFARIDEIKSREIISLTRELEALRSSPGKGSFEDTKKLQDQIVTLTREKDAAAKTATDELQRLREQLDQSQRKYQAMEQEIKNLDGLIAQISRAVAEQAALLDPANLGQETNLFNQINGINQMLRQSLNEAGAGGVAVIAGGNNNSYIPTSTHSNIIPTYTINPDLYDNRIFSNISNTNIPNNRGQSSNTINRYLNPTYTAPVHTTNPYLPYIQRYGPYVQPDAQNPMYPQNILSNIRSPKGGAMRNKRSSKKKGKSRRIKKRQNKSRRK
jgi:predicted  nucleic acid-binding Zn-ribbon protein